MDGMEAKKYEILKIWVPTHGVVNVYRKPGRPGGTGALQRITYAMHAHGDQY